MPTTTEHAEGVMLADWCRLNNLQCWHIPNEGKRGWGAIRKLKQEGLNKGLPDYLIILDHRRTRDRDNLLLFIELKKPMVQLKRKCPRGNAGEWVTPHDSQPTVEQLNFIQSVNSIDGVFGEICFGGEAAIEYIQSFMR